MYANHLGLIVRGGNGAFKLVERYDKKREIGTYHSVDTLERGIERYGERKRNCVKSDARGPTGRVGEATIRRLSDPVAGAARGRRS
jgi:hypothetical protein